MGGKIQVENDGAIEEMIQSAKDSYTKAKTYYEARKEALDKLIVRTIELLDKCKELLNEAIAALERCREAIARTESELEDARRVQFSADDKKDGGIRSQLASAQIAALEQKLAQLRTQETYLQKLVDYRQQKVKECEDQLALAKALKADWEDRGRAALERTRHDSDYQVDFGTRQLASLRGRPSGR